MQNSYFIKHTFFLFAFLLVKNFAIGADLKASPFNVYLAQSNDATPNGITVFPNPMTRPYFLNIKMHNMSSGTYNFKLTNHAGNILWIQEETVYSNTTLYYDLDYVFRGYYNSEMLFLIIELKGSKITSYIPVLIL